MTGYAVLVGGPAGAGKTTAAHTWASAQDEPTAHLNLDEVRRFLCSGLQHPQLTGWNETTARQYDVARRVTVASAREYVSSDFNCVIDDSMFPGRVQARYEVDRDERSCNRHEQHERQRYGGCHHENARFARNSRTAAHCQRMNDSGH